MKTPRTRLPIEGTGAAEGRAYRMIEWLVDTGADADAEDFTRRVRVIVGATQATTTTATAPWIAGETTTTLVASSDGISADVVSIEVARQRRRDNKWR